MTDALDKISEEIIYEAMLDEIQRSEMPQIPGDRLSEFKSHLEDMGVLVTVEHIGPEELSPVQEDYDPDKVEGMAEKINEKRSLHPVLVAEDYEVLDGHHRMLAVQKLNKAGQNMRLPIIRMHAPVNDALQMCMDFEHRVEEGTEGMDQVVVFAGRFHPFHKGHYEDYKKLEGRFGTNNVYVVTSDNTQPPRYPFTFEEKKRMITKLYGIPASQVVESENAYNPEAVLEDRDPESTAFVMALAEEERKTLSETEISEYFDTYNPEGLEGFGKKGYVYEIDRTPLEIKGRNVPAKNIYKTFAEQELEQRTKKAFFKTVFGSFDGDLFELVNEKFCPEPMSVELVERFVQERGQHIKKLFRLDEYSKTAFVDADDGPTTWWEDTAERRAEHEELAEQMGLQILRYLGRQNNFDLKRDGLPFPSFYPSGMSPEEGWQFDDPETLYREFSSKVATAAGFEAMDWLGLNSADDVERHEDFEGLTDKLFGYNMDGDDGPLSSVLDTVRSQTVSEAKKKVMAEGGGAFDRTTSVPAEKTPKIHREFIEHLENVPDVKTDKVVGLGSTRQILNKLPGRKPKSGDIDLLTVTDGASTNEATKTLSRYFDGEDMENKSFFGNIFSVAFDSNHHNTPVQIDLMLAEPSENDRIFRYLRDLKFFSGEEYDPNRNFLLKGLHRTELITRIAKAVGLSMARDGFAVYRWNPSRDSYEAFIKRLKAKKKRTRKQSNIDDLERLLSYLKRFSSMREIKDALFDENGYLDEKFLSNRLRGGPVFGHYASKVLEKELAEKRSLSDRDWEEVFQQFLGAGPNIKQRLESFQDVLDFVADLYKSPDGLGADKIEDAFRVYKKDMQDQDYWSDGLRQKILDTLPFLADVI